MPPEQAQPTPSDAPTPERERTSSPARRFAASAAGLIGLFAVAHLLGFRAYTSVLSGTASFAPLQCLFGLAYLALYGCALLIAPILLIAAALLMGYERFSNDKAGVHRS